MKNQNLAIVTGANKGIGFATVEQLLLHPSRFTVVLTSRDIKRGEEALDTLLTKYPEFKNRLLYHQLDIGSSKSIDDFVNWIRENNKSISILINNAGYLDQSDSANWMSVNYPLFAELIEYPQFAVDFESNPNRPSLDKNFKLPPESIKETLKLNIRGTVELIEKLLPYLDDDGKIISVSSGLGELRVQPKEGQKKLDNPNLDREGFFKLLDDYEQAALKYELPKLGFSEYVYAGSKAFLIAYTRFVLSKMLKSSQAAFTVSPGWVQTDMGGPTALQIIEESYMAAMKIVDFSEEESKMNNGKYYNHHGTIQAF